MRGGVDDDGQGAAVEGFEGAVAAEAFFDQGLPGLGDVDELALAFLVDLFEEGDELAAELVDGLGAELLVVLEALELDEGLVGAGEGHGKGPLSFVRSPLYPRGESCDVR